MGGGLKPFWPHLAIFGCFWPLLVIFPTFLPIFAIFAFGPFWSIWLKLSIFCLVLTIFWPLLPAFAHIAHIGHFLLLGLLLLAGCCFFLCFSLILAFFVDFIFFCHHWPILTILTILCRFLLFLVIWGPFSLLWPFLATLCVADVGCGDMAIGAMQGCSYWSKCG